MHFEVVQTDRMLAVVHGEDRCEFTYSVWTVLNQNTTDVIFGPTNEFLATLSDDLQSELFELYKLAEATFLEVHKLKELKKRIIEINREIIDKINYDDLHAFCKEKGEFYQDPPQPAMTGKNPPEMTYSLAEMFDLRVLCVGVKFLAPIIGSFIVNTKEEIATSQKERVTGEVVTATSIVDWPPYQRYCQYVDALAHRRHSVVPNALRFGTAKSRLDSYLMGMSIVRRFAIARLRSTEDGNIIAYIYTFLDDKLKNLAKDNWNDKFANTGSSNDAEGIGYADHHRVSEDVESDYVVQSNNYHRDIQLVADNLGIGDPAFISRVNEFVLLIRSRLEDYQILPEIHYFLCGLVIKDIDDPRAVTVLTDPDAIHGVIAVSAAFYERKGFKDLAELLLSRRKDRDLGNMSPSTKQVIRHLSHKHSEQLARCYPYVQQADVNIKTNPGKRSIEGLVRIVTMYDWLDVEDISLIRHSIAEHIINIVPEELKTPIR